MHIADESWPELHGIWDWNLWYYVQLTQCVRCLNINVNHDTGIITIAGGWLWQGMQLRARWLNRFWNWNGTKSVLRSNASAVWGGIDKGAYLNHASNLLLTFTHTRHCTADGYIVSFPDTSWKDILSDLWVIRPCGCSQYNCRHTL